MEAVLQKIRLEQQKEKERLLEQERQRQIEAETNPVDEEENSAAETPPEAENSDNSDNPELPTFQAQDAVSSIQTFYNLVSQKQYNQARNYFADPNLLDPNFFNQFTQVTVSDLQVTGENEQYFTLVGTNTYYYPDGTTQVERRDYTLQPIDNQLKITGSNFIRVMKFRG
jgi:serine/threonine-protein kinase